LGVLEARAVEIRDVKRELSLRAAEIEAGHALACAYAFTAALAVREESVLVTGNPEFAQLDRELPMEWPPAAQ